MQTSQEHISYLFRQHFAGKLTPAEKDLFFKIVGQGEENTLIQQLMQQAWEEYSQQREIPQKWSNDVLTSILESNSNKIKPLAPVRNMNRWSWTRYVAAAFILLLAGGYIWWQQSAPKPTDSASNASTFTDLPPGGNKARLILADGSTILLDSAENGHLAQQDGAKIVKLNNGQLVYHQEENSFIANDSTGDYKQKNTLNKKDLNTYNTISTPNGGQYQVTLADGTKVWLNAASSIQFPARFSSYRNVIVTGEVYFEVAPDKNTPFIVTSNDMEIRVLGTSFNINAYTDEPVIKTTLIEGGVIVKKGTKSAQLTPGQQAELERNDKKGNTESRINVSNNANIEQVVAWKNGLFNFQDATLAEVMRQLARWYNIEVRYEHGVPNIEFEGKLGRDVSLSKMLVFFREWGIQYRIENGNILIISKQQ